MVGAVLFLGLGARAAVPPPARGLPTPNVESALQRLTLSLNPSLLARVRLRAEEVWTPAGAHPRRDAETDDVTYYHSVPVEVQISLNGRALSADSLRHQHQIAARLRHELDQQGGGPKRLLDLDGEIWTVGQFVALFNWNIRPGPGRAGGGSLQMPPAERASPAGHRSLAAERPAEAPQTMSGRATSPTLLLEFTPASARDPHSRMGRILNHTAGTLTVDARTGQILAGTFHNLGSVRFGAGLLGDISHFDGDFSMQPVSVPHAGPSGASADCWVMRRIVIHIQGRKLFHRENGTETITYQVVAPVNQNDERYARTPRREGQSASSPACAGTAAGC